MGKIASSDVAKDAEIATTRKTLRNLSIVLDMIISFSG